jgi:hypothetical protein
MITVSLTCARYGWLFTTGRSPKSDRNRPVRTRMPGGVAAGTGLSQVSPGEPIVLYFGSSGLRVGTPKMLWYHRVEVGPESTATVLEEARRCPTSCSSTAGC